jgi:hypothetical protein
VAMTTEALDGDLGIVEVLHAEVEASCRQLDASRSHLTRLPWLLAG